MLVFENVSLKLRIKKQEKYKVIKELVDHNKKIELVKSTVSFYSFGKFKTFSKTIDNMIIILIQKDDQYFHNHYNLYLLSSQRGQDTRPDARQKHR